MPRSSITCTRCSPKRRHLDEYDRGIVLFDTNAIEQRYLAPLLRGEVCRDFELLRSQTPSLKPAIYIKSYYEICQHVKRGDKRFPWCSVQFGYPGGITEGRRILAQLPGCDPEKNLYWWFCMSEEWMALDWQEEEEMIRHLVAEPARESAIHEVRVRKEFTEWKLALSHFCENIWDALESAMTILTPHDVYGSAGEYHSEVFSLEQDLATRRLLPNEDFEIVVAALACRARAFVTAEKELLASTALSIDLNWRTAFVHPDRLREALGDGLEARWSQAQTSPRARGAVPTDG